jgi:hypothetical protein
MEGDRKYKQRGYMDSDGYGAPREERPRQKGPRPPLDVTGPRLPRMVQAVVAARCYSCAAMLAPGIDFRGNCPKCGVALHCCKQCAHFDPSARFQCHKPIPARISSKDKANECALFDSRVTVARDAAPGGSTAAFQAPRTPEDARAAFDNLFKK